MIKITEDILNPETVVNEVRNTAAGCVISYVGLIRDNSHDKSVVSVEYTDPAGKAVDGLKSIVEEVRKSFPIIDMAFHHRIGLLKPGDINIVIAIASGHRGEAFDACRRAVDLFKEKLPTNKVETYTDGTTLNAAD
ncbi:MAG: molybdenum cofactor biosynthesis protein MoaE [Dehalococcoidales bacterium]|nr:molybdenum cofactor biosynthesis protein MoaE [Dehalococcoidales bacterium]